MLKLQVVKSKIYIREDKREFSQIRIERTDYEFSETAFIRAAGINERLYKSGFCAKIEQNEMYVVHKILEEERIYNEY